MNRNAFFEWILDHRAYVLLGLAAVVSIAGWGARRVTIDYGVEQFFLPRGPQRETYDEFKSLFPREDTRVSLFWSDARRPGAALYRDMERAAGWLEAAGLEDVRWLGSVTVARDETIDGEPAVSVGPLVPRETVTDERVAAALRRHAGDRLLEGFLWDTSQTVFIIHGYVRQEDNTDLRRRAIEATLVDSIAAFQRHGTELVLTGLPIARARAPNLLEADIRLLLTSAFIVFGAILYWYFRRGWHVVLSLIAVAPAYVCVLGFLGFAGRPMSILTSFIPIVVLVVGMSDAVHILSDLRHRRMRSAGPRRAIISTFSTMAGPCFYTSVTTAVGFASLAGTRIDIVVDFGLLTAAAIMLTFVFSMTVFPALLSFAPDRRAAREPRGVRWIEALVESAAARAARPSRGLVAMAFAVAAIGVVMAARLRVDTYLIDDTKRSAPFMEDIAWIDGRGFGFFQVNVLLRQTGDRPLHDPDALAWMEDLRGFLATEPVVTHVATPADFLVHLRAATSSDGAAGVPTTLGEASQLLLMAEMQDPAFVEEVYLQADGVAQVIATVRDEGSIVMEPFLDRLQTYLDAHPFPAGRAEVTGTVTMIQHFTDRLLGSFGPSIAIAVVLITAIMMRMFRSVRLGAMALLPNLFPLIVLLAVMAAMGWAVKPSTILVLSIAFGIAVDDTIHLLSRVAHRAGAGPGIASGLTRGLREAGPVMVVTTAIVAAGFILLTASHFTVLMMIGLLTAVSAVTALAADLFVLPSIVSLAESPSRSAEATTAVFEGDPS